MKTQIRTIVIALALLCATPLFAQPEGGDWEFTLGGSGAASEDFDSGGFDIDGSFGYFYNPNLEVAIRQRIGFDDNGDRWSGATRIAGDWHFLLGKFVPFVGLNIGYVYGEDMDDTGMAGPEAGIKYYVHDKTFIFGMAEYQFFFDRVRDIDNKLNDGQWAFTVGIGFNLR